jgi:hypothetical protein
MKDMVEGGGSLKPRAGDELWGFNSGLGWKLSNRGSGCPKVSDRKQSAKIWKDKV